MKKILSFALVLALVLASVATCFAASFSDTEGKDYAKAAEVLAQLDVLHGYPDGTFGGDKTITRAEYVTAIIQALGFKPTAGATGFKDVKSTDWFAPYVAYAKDLGIAYGRTATLFAPADPVSYDEAIAFTTRALGYQDATLALSVSRALGLTDANGKSIIAGIPTGSAPALRGYVAQLIYNAASQPIVKTSSYGFEQKTGSNMFNRLGGSEEVVEIVGNEATAINLVDYIGQKATVVKKAGKIVAVVGKAYTTYTGKFTGTKLVVDATTSYDLSSATKYFLNGSAAAKADVKGQNVVVEGTLSGTTLTAYSISAWVADATPYVAEDATQLAANIKTIKAALPQKNAAADSFQYVVEGVDSIDDIAVFNIVYTYSNGGVTKKVQVGTKTVTGYVTAIAGNKATFALDGTTYTPVKADVLDSVTPSTKVSYTAFFDYAGKAFAVVPTSALTEETKVAKTYALVLATAPAYGLANPAQVQLLLLDGNKKVYNVAAHEAVAKYELVEYKVSATDETYVTLTHAALGLTAVASKDYSAVGTIDGKYVAEDATIITHADLTGFTAPYTFADAKIATIKASELVKGTKGLVMAYADTDADGKIDFIVLKAAAGTTDTKVVGVYNGYNTTADGDVVKFIVNGEAVTYVAKAGVAKADKKNVKSGKMFELTFAADGKVETMTAKYASAATVAAVSVSAVSADGLVLTVGAGKVSLASPIVYKFDATAEAWSVSDVATVVAAKTGEVKLLDTNADSVYDLILIY